MASPASPRRPNPSRPEGAKLQKALARAGLGSRRAMEAAIAAGRVMVGGKRAVLGQRTGPSERIALDGRLLRLEGARHSGERILLYYKPAGEIVSRSDPRKRPSAFDRLPPLRGAQWIAIGRLDFNTSGLLVFTTSGDLANALMHPRNAFEREYAVRILGELKAQQIERLRSGVALRDGQARFERIEPLGGRGANRWYRAVLKEGRNREVRRMFEALGIQVSRLIRVRFGPFSLSPRLRRGNWEEIPRAEVRRLIAGLGLGRQAGLGAKEDAAVA
ncbi:MAG: pseudouridine synthase [Betaproteobacteria bacterium]|nr:pseudouridine synthase [Betaproteobacteria bacterium]